MGNGTLISEPRPGFSKPTSIKRWKIEPITFAGGKPILSEADCAESPVEYCDSASVDSPKRINCK